MSIDSKEALFPSSSSVPSVVLPSCAPAPPSSSSSVPPPPPSNNQINEVITSQQMSQIQFQIRKYKLLTKKYNDMKLLYSSSSSSLTSQPPSTTWQVSHILSGLGSSTGQEGMIGINTPVSFLSFSFLTLPF